VSAPNSADLMQSAVPVAQTAYPVPLRTLLMVQDEELTADRSTPVVHFRFLSATDIQIIKTPVRVPRATAIAERFVGTLRRELLDRPLIINQRRAAAVLRHTSAITTIIAAPRSWPGRSPTTPAPHHNRIQNVLVTSISGTRGPAPTR